ncbi:hypothetical protein B0O99DRAFT_654048 [Bisporella sp. PMI_857]|nr:hypothetical protein B0O99DRAFT_654048 [Bisporella sp. PMI_857]
MQHRQHVRNVEDDWTGTTNRLERRKRQNRLSQRAYRNRHQQKQPDPTSLDPDCASNKQLVRFHGCSLLPTIKRREEAQLLAQQMYHNYRSGMLRHGYLSLVTKLNILDAISHNAAALGFTVEGLCCDELISPFNLHGPEPAEGAVFRSCPPTLRPTLIQRTMIHHPWIDLFPIPHFRDNVLIATNAGMLDEDELCADLLRIREDNDAAQLIVWAGSWDIQGWEASVPFLKKWGWLMRGCLELCRATNEWRDRRGEKRLYF